LTFKRVHELVSLRQPCAEQRPEAALELADDEQVPVSVGWPAFALRQARLVRRFGGAVHGIPEVQGIDQPIRDRA
jgi:hypothetical protein